MNHIFIKNLFASFMSGWLFQSCTSESDSPDKVSVQLESLADVKTKIVSPPEAFATVPKIVDQLPFFGGTASKEDSDKALIEYLVSNLEYP